MWWVGRILLLILALAVGGGIAGLVGGQPMAYVVEVLILAVWIAYLIRDRLSRGIS